MTKKQQNKLILQFLTDHYRNWHLLEVPDYNANINLLLIAVDRIQSHGFCTELNFIFGLGHRFYVTSAGTGVYKARVFKSREAAIFDGVVKFIIWFKRNSCVQAKISNQ